MQTFLKHSTVLATLALTSIGQALSAEVERSLEFGIISSDNADLSFSDEQSELALEVKPRVEATIQRRLFDTDIIGELAFFKFRDSDVEVLDPRLTVRTRGFLVPELLALEAGFRLAKSTSDFDVFELRGDPDPTLLARFNPTLSKTFGNFATLDASFLHQSIDTETTGSFDGIENTFSTYFGRDPLLHSFLWGIGADYDLSKGLGDRAETYSLYYLLGYAFADTSTLELSSGKEFNDFDGIESDDEETTIWDITYRWRPSERTTLDLGYGERFFGTGPTIRFRLTGQRSDLRFSWLRGVTRTAPRLEAITPFEDPADGPDLSSSSDAPSLTEVTEAPFSEDRLRVEFRITGRRSDLIFDTVYAEQDQLAGDTSIDTLLSRIVLDRYLSPTSRLRWTYSFADSTSDQREDLNYRENRLAVRWIKTLR